MSAAPRRNDAERARLSAELRGFLSHTQAGVTALAEHLRTTGQALARGDCANLAAYLDHEMALLGSLESIFQRQHAVLAEFGLSPDRAGLEQAMSECGDAELADWWRCVRQELDLCRELNSANATTAKQSRRSAEASLRILRGASGEEPGYGRDGDLESPAGDTQVIARA